jgi:large repetitive protein
MFTWRQWLRSWFAPARRTLMRPLRRRLSLELLEDRLTPSSFVWSGAASANWSSGANWIGGAAPSTGGADSLIFPSSLSSARFAMTDDFSPSATFQSIAFNGGGYSVSGVGVSLTVTGTINSSNAAGVANENAIGVPIQTSASGNVFITVTNTGAFLNLSGNLTTPANPTVQITVNGGGGGAAGTLILSGDNSGLDAPITVQSGVLQAASPTALGDALDAALVDTVQSGAQLQVTSAAGVSITAPLLLLNGNGIGNAGAMLNVASNNTWASNIKLDSNVTLGANTGTALAFTGQISDQAGTTGFGITEEDGGTITLDPLVSQGNTYRGQTVVNNGLLQVSESHALGAGNTTLAPGAVPQPNDALGQPVPGIAIVNSFSDRSGTLQLVFDPKQVGIDPFYTATGFSVPAEPLIINGPGVQGVAAYYYQPRSFGNTAIPTVTTAAFTQPAVGSTVTVSTSLGFGVLALTGQMLAVAGGGDYVVQSVGPLSLTLLNIGLPGNAPVGANVPTGATVTEEYNSFGALNNASGNNEWAQNVALWSDSAAVFAANSSGNTNLSYGHVSVGVQGNSSLQIDGKIGDNANVNPVPAVPNNFYFDKIDIGNLILTNANTYNTGTLPTEILTGTLTIEDSQALGASNSTILVNPLSGNSLNFAYQPFFAAVMPATNEATLELKTKASPDSVTGTNQLLITKNVDLTDAGVKGVGALYNNSGVNTVAGAITLSGIYPVGGSIGVSRDPSIAGPAPAYAATSQLTITSEISPGLASLAQNQFIIFGNIPPILPPAGFLHKVGRGELVLDPTVVNPVTKAVTPGANDLKQTYIDQGWITIENSLALGTSNTHTYAGTTGTAPYFGQFPNNNGVTDGITNGTVVAAGAAVVLKQNPLGADPVTGTANLSVPEDLILNGNGLSAANTLTYKELYQSATDPQKNSGALINLSGNNTITGIVYLNGTVGIGVALDEHAVPAVTTSELNLGPIGQFAGQVGGIDKWGIKGLNLQGEGWYTGNVDIHFGVLTVQNTTALGLGTTPATTTVENGAALILQGNNPAFSAGDNVGVEIGVNENFILNGPGNTTLTGTLISTLTSANAPGTNTPFDNLLRSPITLGTNNVNIDVQANSRLTLYGTIDDAPAGAKGGFGFNYNASAGATGELDLGGSNTYRGSTTINQGIVDVMNGQGLGASVAPVFVTTVAGLQFQGNITVANPLNIVGTGPAGLPNIPITWFAQGPSPITGATQTTSGTDPVSGEVTAVAADATDANLLYLTSAGGGAWRSRNAGQSWQPLVDTTTQVLVQTGVGTFTPLTLGQLGLFANTITTSPSGVNGLNHQVAPAPGSPDFIYIGLGDQNNSPNSFGGAGVLASTNGGLTWTLLQGPNGEFVGKAISQISMDPANPNIIYIAVAQARGTNTSSGNPPTGTGLWKYDPTQTTWYDPANPRTSVWDDMTADLPTADAKSTRLTGNMGPGTPGPEDDLNLSFTNTDDYTSVVVYDDPVNTLSHTDLNQFFQFFGGGVQQFVSPNNKIIFLAVGTENPQPQGGAGSANYLNGVYISVDGGTTWNLYGFPTSTAADVINKVPNAHAGRISLAVNYTLPNILPENTGNPDPFAAQDVDQQGTFTVDALVTYPGNYAFSANTGVNLQPIPALRDTFREIDSITLTWDLQTGANFDRPLNYNAPNAGGGFGIDVAYLGWAPGGIYTKPGMWNTTVAAAGLNANVMGTPNSPSSFTAGTTTGDDNRGQYDNAIAIDPGNSQVIYVGGIGLDEPQGIVSSGIYQSLDGGATFTQVETQGTAGPHSDAHSLTFDAGSAHLIVGTNGGIWEMSTPDVAGGGTWTSLNTAYLQITQFNSLVANPSDPFQAVGGTQANGFVTYTDTSWQETDAGNSNSVLVNSQNPNILYQMTDAGLRESTNGGVSWSTVFANNTYFYQLELEDSPYADPYQNFQNNGFINGIFQNTGTTGSGSLGLQTDFAPAVIDSNNPNRLLAYVYNAKGANNSASIWQSLDGGATWSDLDPNEQILADIAASTSGFFGFGFGLTQGYFATSIGLANFQGPFASDPRFPAVTDQGANTLVPGTIYVTSAYGVFMTKNDGNTWVEVDNTANGLPIALQGVTRFGFTQFNGYSQVHYQDVAVDPNNENIAYVAASDNDPTHGHIFRTADGGQTWTDLTSNLPANLGVWKVLVDPRNENVYIGTDDGVWMLPGGTGAAWQRVGNGLPEAQVRDLSLNTSLNTLTAGTFGRGAYTMWLDNPLPVTVPAAQEGVLRSISGSPTLTGAITLGGDITIRTDANSQLSLLGNITGPGDAIVKVGSGTLVLGGDNNYGGATTDISYTPTGGTSMFVDTNIEEGTLAVHNPNALGSALSGTVVQPAAVGSPLETPPVLDLQSDVLTGETVVLNGDGGSFNHHRTGSLRNSSSNNTFNGTIILNSNSTIGVDSGSQLTITGTIIDNGQGYSLTKDLPGTLVFGGTSTFTYTGPTALNQGALQIQNAKSVLNSTGIKEADATQVQLVGGVDVITKGTLTLAGTGIFNTGAIVSLSGNNIWQGPIALANDPGVFPITNPGTLVAVAANPGTSLTINGVISEQAPSFTLSKLNLGTVTLQQNDTYSGPTLVNAGILNIQANSALGLAGSPAGSGATTTVLAGASLEMQGGITTPAAEALILNGTGVGGEGALHNTLGMNTWSGTVTLPTSTAIDAAAGSMLTVGGAIGDPAPAPVPAASLTIGALAADTGTILFPSANTYLGQTLVNNGVLLIHNAGALGGAGGAGTLVNTGGTLQLGNGITVATETLVLNGPGANGLGALDANSTQNSAGNVNTTDTWNNAILLGSNASLGADSGTTLVLNKAITDGVPSKGFGVTKVGAGTVDYAGGAGTGNTYSGTTTVSAGTLLLDKSSPSTDGPFAGPLVVGGGATPAEARWLFSKELPGNDSVTVNANGLANLNDKSDTIGNLAITDGTVRTAGPVGGLAVLNVNSLVMTGGAITLDRTGSQLVLGGNVTASSDATGPALINSSAGGATGTVSLNGANRTFTVNAQATPVPIDMSIAVPIAGTGAEELIKAGNGVLQLPATNTYAGLTSVTGGTLEVDGTIANVSLDGGTVSGIGTVGTIASTTGGGVSPGGNPGTLTSTGTVTWNAQTVFSVSLFDNGGVLSNDLLVANGNVNLGNAILAGSFTNVQNGDTFTILHTTSGTISGTFATANPFFISGRKFTIAYLPVGAPTSVVVTAAKNNTAVAVVPSAAAPVYGQPLSYTITVTPELGSKPIPVGPGGDTVSVSFDGGAPIKLTLTTQQGTAASVVFTPANQPLSIGNHTLTVTYNGDNDFNSSSLTPSPLTVAVAQAATTATVASSANPSAFNQAITLTATVAAVAPSSTGTPTGTVTFFLDGAQVGTAQTINAAGQATLPLTNLTVGAHQVHVNYSGDTNYLPFNMITNVVQTVNEDTTSVTVTSGLSPTVFGQNVTFTAAVISIAPGSGIPTGQVNFSDGATFLGSGTLDKNGNATFTTGALAVGSHTINAAYASDGNYNTSTGSVTEVVNQDKTTSTIASSVNPSANGQPVSFTATITAANPGAGTPTGTVIFSVDGVQQLPGLALVNGQATFNDPGLAQGAHTIAVAYSGDTNFLSSTGTLAQGVGQANTSTTLTSSINPSVYGQPVTLTATVAPSGVGSGTPTGSVTFTVDGTSTVANLSPTGVATLTLTTLTGGTNHTITASYSGDNNFFTSSTFAPLTQQVNPASTTISVASSANPSVFGQAVAFTATVAAVAPGGGVPAGSVTFTIDAQTFNVPLVAGAAVLTLNTLSVAANHNVTATYNGSANYLSSTTGAALVEQVNQDASVTGLSSSANPSVVGQTITLTATVGAQGPGAGTPTGQVTFTIDSVAQKPTNLDATGKATLTLTNLGVGPHTFSVTYAGDTNFLPSNSATVSQQVNLSNTTTTVASSVNPSVFGQTVNFTATVGARMPGAGMPTGTVTFTIDTVAQAPVPLVNGVATLPFASLSVGSHNIVAKYNGDSNFTPSTSGATPAQVVNQDATTVGLSSSANPSVFGQGVTITATISPQAPGSGTPTGTVTFTVDSSPQTPVNLVNGQATLPLTALSVGTHTVTASYSGDSSFTTSATAKPLSQLVNVAGTTTTLAAAPNPSTFGTAVKLTATVTATSPGAGIPTGQVNFFANGTSLGSAPLTNGQAIFNTTALLAGKQNLTASYVTDNNFGSSTTASAVVEQVNPSTTSTTLAAVANPSTYGTNVAFTVNVSALSGAGTPTGTVALTIDGTAQSAVNLTNGQAVINVATLSAGSHNITATYSGDNNFLTSITASTLVEQVNKALTDTALAASPAPAVYGQSVTFTATVTSRSPGVVPDGAVTFIVDGQAQAPAVALDANGKATLMLNNLMAQAQPHTITANYAGSNNFSASTTTSTLSEQIAQDGTSVAVTGKPTPSVFGQNVTFTAQVSAVAPGGGIPTGTVTFAVNGNAQTPSALDANGQATFSLSTLSVGSASITAAYSGDTNFTTSTSAVYAQQVNQAGTTTALSSALNPANFGQSVTFTATVAAVAPGVGVPTGSVIFTVDNVAQKPVPLVAGKATYTLTGASVNTHNITATYSGDTNFQSSGTQTAFVETINQDPTTVALAAPSTSVFGQSVTFTATVTPNDPGAVAPTGSVVFTIDGTPQAPVALSAAGTASLADAALSVGAHTITATYSGDGNFLGNLSSAATETVGQASSGTLLSAVPAASVYGENVVFKAAVSPVSPGAGLPTGNVVFNIDGTDEPAVALVNGQASFAISSLAASTTPHSITATYAGDINFMPSVGTASLIVNAAATTSTLTILPAAPIFGQAVTVMAAVAPVPAGAGIPTGQVSFTIDSNAPQTVSLDANGNATLTLTNLGAGPHTINAAYLGDGQNFQSSKATPLSPQVAQANTTTALASSATPTSFGSTVTFTASVSPVAPGAGVPTGSITFTIDSTNSQTVTLNATGQAILTQSTLTRGSHTITAQYTGDSNFAASTTSLTQQITNAATTTTLTETPTSAVYGQAVTYTAVVASAPSGLGTPTGSVIFTVDGTPTPSVALDGTGTATLTLSQLSVGTHTVTAAYSGDNQFAASVSAAPLSEPVGKDATSVALSSAGTPAPFGQNIVFTATINPLAPGAGIATGTVIFSIDGTAQPAVAVDATGKATLTLNNLTRGSHQIGATYSGDNNFTANSALFTQQVNNAASSTALTASPTPSVFGQTITVTATVSSVVPSLTTTPTGTVTFMVDSTPTQVTVDSTGKASLTLLALTANTHTITASYSGDSFYSASGGSLSQVVNPDGSTITVTSSATPSVFGQTVTITATVAAAAPGAGIPSGSVTFTVDGGIQAPVTLANGQAFITLNAPTIATHQISASYGGDGNFQPSSTTAPLAQQVVPASTAITLLSAAAPAVFGQAVSITATVGVTAPGAGTPTGSILFTVDGTPQTPVVLDATDKAVLTLPLLGVGSHTIAATYSGDADFQGSATALTQQVSPAASATTLVASTSPSPFGQAATFTATISPIPAGIGVPTGLVTFTVDGIAQAPVPLDTSAKAVLTLTALSVGSHTITANYSGDTSFQASSATLSQQIVQAVSSTSVGVAAVSDQSATLTATVGPVAPGTGTPDGSVTFLVDGAAVGVATLVNGTATFTATGLAIGTHTLSAVYGGNISFLPSSSASISQTITSSSPSTPVTPVTPATPKSGPIHTLQVRVIKASHSKGHAVFTLRVTAFDRLDALSTSTTGRATLTLIKAPRGVRVGGRQTVNMKHGTGLTSVKLPITGGYTYKVTFGKVTTTITLVNGGRRQG